MKQIPLLKRIDLRPHGGQHVWFVRTETGGDLRMIAIQSAGMEDSKLYRMGRFLEQHWIEEEDQDHLCITAMDAEGNALWTRKEGSVTPVRWRPEDAEDLLLHRRPDAPPTLVDGRLAPVMRLEAGEALMASQKPPKEDPYAVADYGNFLGFKRQDMDGDGAEEMVFHNRYTMWVYGGAGSEK